MSETANASIRVRARSASAQRAGRGTSASPTRPKLGAHWSIAGGLHHALEEAARYRAGAVQIFSKTSGQWKAKPLAPEAIRLFRETHDRLGPFETAVHDS